MSHVQNVPEGLDKPGIKAKLVDTCQKNGIAFLGFFGSFARGEGKPESDIDILIKFKEGEKKSLLDLIKLENELSDLFKRRIDLLTLEAVSPYLREEVLSNLHIAYEAR